MAVGYLTQGNGPKAIEALKLLCIAYNRGEDAGGSMDWSDVDAALNAAREALPEAERLVRNRKVTEIDSAGLDEDDRAALMICYDVIFAHRTGDGELSDLDAAYAAACDELRDRDIEPDSLGRDRSPEEGLQAGEPPDMCP